MQVHYFLIILRKTVMETCFCCLVSNSAQGTVLLYFCYLLLFALKKLNPSGHFNHSRSTLPCFAVNVFDFVNFTYFKTEIKVLTTVMIHLSYRHRSTFL